MNINKQCSSTFTTLNSNTFYLKTNWEIEKCRNILMISNFIHIISPFCITKAKQLFRHSGKRLHQVFIISLNKNKNHLLTNFWPMFQPLIEKRCWWFSLTHEKYLWRWSILVKLKVNDLQLHYISHKIFFHAFFN